MMAIKICELTKPKNMLSVNETLSNYISFVFTPSKI